MGEQRAQDDDRRTEVRWHGPRDAAHTLILAPGDDGGLHDPAPTRIAHGLADAGVRVGRFACPGGPLGQRDARQAATIRSLAAQVAGTLVLGGLSRGARVSADLVEALDARGLVVFAYPFHGRNDPLTHGREVRLGALKVPVLLVQGTRDSHGNREQVRGYRLDGVSVHWLEDANHALRPRRSAGSTQAEQLDGAVRAAVQFIRAL